MMKEIGKTGLEAYLIRRIKEKGGHRRKLKFIGVNGAPDQLVKLKKWRRAKLVEVKKPNGGVLAMRQKREHEKLRKDFGFEVVVVYTKEDVEELLK